MSGIDMSKIFGNSMASDSIDDVFNNNFETEETEDEQNENISESEIPENDNESEEEMSTVDKTAEYFRDISKMAEKIKNEDIKPEIKKRKRTIKEKKNKKTYKEIKKEKIEQKLSSENRRKYMSEDFNEAKTLINFGVDRIDIPNELEISLDNNEKGTLIIPERHVLYRTDNGEFLGDVSKKYKLIKHDEFIDIIHASIKEIYPDYVENIKCVINDNGSVMWYTFIFDSIRDLVKEITKGEYVSASLTFGNSYNRSVPCTCKLSANRAICDNYMVSDMRSYNVSLRHSKNTTYKIFENISKRMISDFVKLGSKWEKWTLNECSLEKATAILKYMELSTPTISSSYINSVIESLDTGFGKEKESDFRENRWSLYNLMTYIASHTWVPSHTNNVDLARLKISYDIAPFISNDKLFSMDLEDLQQMVLAKEEEKDKKKKSKKERDDFNTTGNIDSVNTSDK